MQLICISGLTAITYIELTFKFQYLYFYIKNFSICNIITITHSYIIILYAVRSDVPIIISSPKTTARCSWVWRGWHYNKCNDMLIVKRNTV